MYPVYPIFCFMAADSLLQLAGLISSVSTNLMRGLSAEYIIKKLCWEKMMQTSAENRRSEYKSPYDSEYSSHRIPHLRIPNIKLHLKMILVTVTLSASAIFGGCRIASNYYNYSGKS